MRHTAHTSSAAVARTRGASRLTQVRAALQAAADPQKAVVLQRFFKTGKGEYGEGDQFIGIVVPTLRALAKKHRHLTFTEVQKLLKSPIHEERLVALLILVLRFQASGRGDRRRLFRFYVNHLRYVNNWDLIDGSAEYIIGSYLLETKKTLLYTLARSKRMWDRRVAIISTFQFIKERRFTATLKIAKILLTDDEDLIHKAVGWMLREVGKRDQDVEERFLRAYHQKMPRTMLRYAIERFPKRKRLAYLAGNV